MPGKAKELEKLIDENWKVLNGEGSSIESANEDEKRRKVFAKVLESAVGAHLEGTVNAVKAEAG